MTRRGLTAILLAIVFVVVVLWVRQPAILHSVKQPIHQNIHYHEASEQNSGGIDREIRVNEPRFAPQRQPYIANEREDGGGNRQQEQHADRRRYDHIPWRSDETPRQKVI